MSWGKGGVWEEESGKRRHLSRSRRPSICDARVVQLFENRIRIGQELSNYRSRRNRGGEATSRVEQSFERRTNQKGVLEDHQLTLHRYLIGLLRAPAAGPRAPRQFL
jgi:chorismate mutase